METPQASKRIASFLVVTVVAIGTSASGAQQQSSRLLLYGPHSYQQVPYSLFPSVTLSVPAGHSLYELDPGGFASLKTPIVPPTAGYTGSALFQGGYINTAFDQATGRLFVYDAFVGGTLRTIDAGTGAVLHNSVAGTNLLHLEFESSTGRLLAFATTGAIALVELNVATGATMQIGTGIQAGTAFGTPGFAVIDPATHTIYAIYSGAGLLAVNTLTGASSFVPFVSYSSYLTGYEWDADSGRILAMGGPASSGLHAIDPITGVVTLIGGGFGISTGVFTVHALDNQRGLYHIFGSGGAFTTGAALYSYDTTTGMVVADNVVLDWTNFQYASLEIDHFNPPARGRVDISPRNVLWPPDSASVTFDAFGHAGEYYVPFVSCTLGSLAIPNSSLVIPLAFDACSQLYFFDSAAQTLMSFTPPGQFSGILSSQGRFQGTLTMPSALPPGFSLELHITFLTMNAALQWTGLHGLATLHLRS